MDPDYPTNVLADPAPPLLEPESSAPLVPERTPARADESLTSHRLVGRYELLHRLANGGMATVYLGRATGSAGFEKVVAVKVIHPHLANEPEFVRMFLDEARIAARIHHPHVVETLDLGEDDGIYYMVLEFIEGENLARLVRALEPAPLPVVACLQVLSDALEGLGAAHGLRDPDGERYEIVHRDISPHNLLVTLDGWVKVADFGIMKASGKASNTRTGELRGKLAYMSPEQARGKQIDHRSDLYSLGVIAWELLAGRRLFAASTEAATLERVIRGHVPPLEDELCARLGDDAREFTEHLSEFLARALASRPDNRFADAAQMVGELRSLLRECPIPSHGPKDPREILSSFMREHFSARLEYAKATLRSASSGQGASQSQRRRRRSSRLTVDPSLVARALDGTQAAAAPIGSVAAGSHESLPAAAVSSRGAITMTGTATVPDGPRWMRWAALVLLPLFGAAIAIAAMRMEPDRGSGVAGDGARDGREGPRTGEQATGGAGDGAADRQAVVRWFFDTDPPGATIVIAGRRQPTLTPGFVTVVRSEEPVEVVLTREGFAPRKLKLLPVGDQSYSERLDQLEPGEAEITQAVHTQAGQAGETGQAPRVNEALRPPTTGIKRPKGKKPKQGTPGDGDAGNAGQGKHSDKAGTKEEDWMGLPGAEGQGG